MDLIGRRKVLPELQKLYEAKKHVYSISKLNTLDNCPYEAWLSYIAKRPKTNNIYGLLGDRFHDRLEAIMNGKSTEASLSELLTQSIGEMDMLGIAFPKSHRGDDSIRNGWIADMTHFCNTFVKPNGSFQTERFLLHQLSEDRYLQGYVDLIRFHSDKRISVYDWKTSSDFARGDLLHYGRQLILYAYILEHQGFTIHEVAWIMLKYVNVSYVTFSKKADPRKVNKIVKRGKLASIIADSVKSNLIKHGYSEDDASNIVVNFIHTNTLTCLPPKIQGLYTVKPYVKKYPYTPALVNEALSYVDRLAAKYETTQPDEKLWLPRDLLDEKGKEDTFYCNTLCNFRKSCKYILRHRDSFFAQKSTDQDLF